MQSNFRNVAIWVMIALLLVALFNLFQNPTTSRRGANELGYSEFIDAVEKRQCPEVTIAGQPDHRQSATGNGRTFTTLAPGRSRA